MTEPVIVERWKGKYERLVVQSNGSKAQHRYASPLMKLIEELSFAERDNQALREAITAERRISEGCRSDASRMGDKLSAAETLLTAAGHALRSYQYGYASTELAESMANSIDAALKETA